MKISVVQAGHARLESFEVVQIADANRVEVSMAPSAQQFLGKFEKLSRSLPGLHLPK
jgi:hypothetical protein